MKEKVGNWRPTKKPGSIGGDKLLVLLSVIKSGPFPSGVT